MLMSGIAAFIFCHHMHLHPQERLRVHLSSSALALTLMHVWLHHWLDGAWFTRSLSADNWCFSSSGVLCGALTACRQHECTDVSVFHSLKLVHVSMLDPGQLTGEGWRMQTTLCPRCGQEGAVLCSVNRGNSRHDWNLCKKTGLIKLQIHSLVNMDFKPWTTTQAKKKSGTHKRTFQDLRSLKRVISFWKILNLLEKIN